jgi:hypothetical protein
MFRRARSEYFESKINSMSSVKLQFQKSTKKMNGYRRSSMILIQFYDFAVTEELTPYDLLLV